jgi:hypothetical protein
LLNEETYRRKQQDLTGKKRHFAKSDTPAVVFCFFMAGKREQLNVRLLNFVLNGRGPSWSFIFCRQSGWKLPGKEI